MMPVIRLADFPGPQNSVAFTGRSPPTKVIGLWQSYSING